MLSAHIFRVLFVLPAWYCYYTLNIFAPIKHCNYLSSSNCLAHAFACLYFVTHIMQRLLFTCSRQRSHFNYFSWHRVLNTPCLVTRHNTHTRRSHRMLLLFVCVCVCACVCYVLTIEIGLFHCFSSVQDLLPVSRVQFAQHETNASVPRKTGEPKPDSTCAEQLRLIT